MLERDPTYAYRGSSGKFGFYDCTSMSNVPIIFLFLKCLLVFSKTQFVQLVLYEFYVICLLLYVLVLLVLHLLQVLHGVVGLYEVPLQVLPTLYVLFIGRPFQTTVPVEYALAYLVLFPTCRLL